MRTVFLACAIAGALASGFAIAAPAESEAEATALLLVVNGHEILAADLAASKGVGAPVAEYAAMLRTEHSANQDATRQLPEAEAASKIDSPPVVGLQDKAAAERGKLAQIASGEAFETAYVDAMVNGHAEALVMLDEQLIPAAVSPEAKAHFAQTREHIAMHLEKARELQGK